MRKWLIIFLLTSFNFVNAQVLTLEEALRIALENNYSIVVAKNEAAIATSNNTPGAAGMMPTVTGTINQDNQVVDTKQKFLSGAENNKTGAKSSQLGVNVELGWTIFDGLKMFAVRNRLSELQQAGELKLKNNIENTFSRVIKSYHDVMLYTMQLKASQETVKNSQSRYELAEDKYKAGKSPRTELLKAQVDLNSDLSSLLRIEQNLNNAKIGLNLLLARDLKTTFSVPDSIPVFGDYNIDEINQKAVAQNTGVNLAKRNLRVNQLSLEEVKAERMPQIQLKTGYNFNRQESQAGFLQSAQNTGFHYGAGLTMNLFNGFDVNRKVRNARLAVKSGDAIYRDSLARLMQSVTIAYNNYSTGKKLAEIEKSNVDLAKENYQIAAEQYRLGVITSLELREVQLNLLNTQLRLFTAQYETRLAESELKRLTGQLIK